MKTPEELRQYAAKYPHLTPALIASNLRRKGVCTADVRAALEGHRPLGPATIAGMTQMIKATTSGKPMVAGKPLSSLIDQYDDIKKVRQAMKALPKDSYLEDEEMRRELNIGYDRWKSVVQHPQLQSFRYQLPSKKSVWMHPDAQAKLTATINMTIE